MSDDLKPCPFCGGDARMWQDPSHSAAWFIGCEDGDRDCFGSIHWAETQAEAIAAWNRRATPEALAASPEVQVMIEAAEARGMERAAEIAESIRIRIANGPMPEGARFDYEQAIRAEAAALRSFKKGE